MSTKAIKKLKEDLSSHIGIDEPWEVLEEAVNIISRIYPGFDFDGFAEAFVNVVKLFNGSYDGYKECNTGYHDLHHTTDVLLATARLLDGAFIKGHLFRKRDVELALIAALFHDAGYIQHLGDSGTGAKYTVTHVQRGIEFLEKYFVKHKYRDEKIRQCAIMIKCTDIALNVSDLEFDSDDLRTLSYITGTSDIVAQMADKSYIDKLVDLYEEFSEAGIGNYENHLDLLKKTGDFSEVMKRRLKEDLGDCSSYMMVHFKERHGISMDLYKKEMEENLIYLKYLVDNYDGEQ